MDAVDTNVWFSFSFLKLREQLRSNTQREEIPGEINRTFQRECVSPLNFQYKINLIHELLTEVKRINVEASQKEADVMSEISCTLEKQIEVTTKAINQAGLGSYWCLHKQIMCLPSISPDMFTTAKIAIQQKIHLAYDTHEIVTTVKNLLPDLLPPWQFFYQCYESINECLVPLIGIADKIRQVLSLESQEQTAGGLVSKLILPLRVLSKIYDEFIHEFKASPTDDKKILLASPKATLVGAGFACFLLDQNVAQDLLGFKENGQNIQTSFGGTHCVSRKENVFYKPDTEGRFHIGPEREYAIFSLYSAIGNTDTIAPAVLLKIQSVYTSDGKVHERALQASYGINGLLLQDVLTIIELFPFLESCMGENQSVSWFRQVFSEELYEKFQKENPELSYSVIQDLPIEKAASRISDAIAKVLKNVAASERFREFENDDLPLRDFCANIHYRTSYGLIHLLALLPHYMQLCTHKESNSSEKVPHSFIQVTDCINVVRDLKKKIYCGMDVDIVIKNVKELHGKFDGANFGTHVIGSLLSIPEDHKSDNIMVTSIKNSQGEIESLSMVGIDNDIALDVNNHRFRSVIFFLEQMKQPVHHSIVEKLQKTTPEEIVLDWIISMEEQNRLYSNICQLGFITHDDLFENKEPSIRIPFEIKSTFVAKMFHRIKQIHSLLQNNNPPTYQELFEATLPDIARAYAKVCNISSFEKKYKEFTFHMEKIKNADPVHSHSPAEEGLAFIKSRNMESLSLKTRVSLIGKGLRAFPAYGKELLPLLLTENADQFLHEIYFTAVQFGYSELVAYLLEQEMVKSLQNPDDMFASSLLSIKNEIGQTAFLISCDKLHKNVVHLLLLYKANTAEVDHLGRNCICTLLDHFPTIPTEVSCFIKELGIKAKIRWNQSYGKHGDTALHQLIRMFHVAPTEAEPLLQFFLEQGASPDLVNKDQKTALDLAIQLNLPKVVDLLVRHSAGRSLDCLPAIHFFMKHSKMNDTFRALQQQSLTLRWTLVLNELRLASVASSDTVLIGVQLGRVNLPPTLCTELLENGNIRSGIQFGRRNVQKIQVDGHDVYFKQYPEMPGVEYAVGSLFELLIGHGTSYTDIARLNVSKKRWFPVCISQGIQGENLYDILRDATRTQEFQQRLDHRSFSELFLASLLVNFEDAKPDNFIVEQLPNGKVRLIGIDNDHAFVPSMKSEGSKIILVKCILYCLECVNEPIHPIAREKFLSFNIQQILEIWLNKLAVQNNYHNKLFSLKEHKELSKESKGRSATVLSIPFQKGSIKTIFQTFQRIQMVLQEDESICGLDLLRLVVPDLGAQYYQAFISRSTPMERFLLLTKKQYSISHGFETLIGSKEILKTLKIKSALPDNVNIGPDIALQELHQIINELESSENRKRIHEEIQKGNVYEFDKLILDTEKEKIINGIPGEFPNLTFAHLPPEKAKDLLKSVIRGNYRTLVLDSIEKLGYSVINRIKDYSPMLQSLTLKNIQRSSTLVELPSQLTSLHYDNFSFISGDTDIGFKNLQHFSISRCHKVKKLNLPPSLVTIKIVDCWKLVKIATKKWNKTIGMLTFTPAKCIVKSLHIQGCPKLELWNNAFGAWLQESSSHVIQLQHAPINIKPYTPDFNILLQSVLRKPPEIATGMLASCCKLYTFSFFLYTLATLKRVSVVDPFGVIVESYLSELADLIDLDWQIYGTFINRNVSTRRVVDVSQYCPKLQRLNLGDCLKVEDAAVLALSKNCVQLKDVKLSRCSRITDVSVCELATACQNLERLHLDACVRITDATLGALAQRTSLTDISLAGCIQITDKGLLALADTEESHVSSLSLGGCERITNHGIAAVIDKLPLETLCLDGCSKITDEALIRLSSRLPMLKTFSMNNCKNITPVTYPEFSSCSSLQSLSMSNSSLSQTTCSDLFSSLSALKLTHLDVSINPISSPLAPFFSSQCTGVSLNANYCQITSEDLQELGSKSLSVYSNMPVKWTNIIPPGQYASLDFTNREIDDEYIRTNSKVLSSLQTIYVNNNINITDKSLRIFKNKKLSTISLRNCFRVTDTGIASLVKSCPLLEYIDLTRCFQITNQSIQHLVSETKANVNFSHCVLLTDTVLNFLVSGRILSYPINFTGCIQLTGTSIKSKDGVCVVENVTLDDCRRFSPRGFLNFVLYIPGISSISLSNCVLLNDECIIELCSRCSFLQKINLSNCSRITDRGASAIGQKCPQVTSLILQDCIALTELSLIEIAKGCNCLTYLNMDRCNVTDSVLVAIGQYCSILAKLSVHECTEITDEGIKALQGLQLLELHISENPNISDEALRVLSPNLDLLENATFFHCPKITSQGLLSLSSLQRRQIALKMDGSQCSEKLFGVIQESKYLQHVHINDYNFSESCCLDFSKFKAVHLPDCKSSSVPIFSSGMHLVELDVNGCPASWRSETVAAIQNSVWLETLNIRGMDFCSKLSKAISKKRFLRFLDVSQSTISDEDLNRIGECYLLETINLSDCMKISDVGLKYLCSSSTRRLFALSNIDISGCSNITDAGLASIIEVSPLLESLSVSGSITDNSIALLSTKCIALCNVTFKSCLRLTNQSLISLSSCFLLRLHLENNSYFSTSGLDSIASTSSHLQQVSIIHCPKITCLPALPYLTKLITIPPLKQ